MTTPEQRAYQRGYSAGLNRKWPLHAMPVPPDPVVAELLASLLALRNEYDTICATFGEDDEIVLKLAPVVDRADAAMEAVAVWLRQRPQG